MEKGKKRMAGEEGERKGPLQNLGIGKNWT
jgi:hypothetical protein